MTSRSLVASLSFLLVPLAAAAGGTDTPKVEPKTEPGPTVKCTVRSILAEEKPGGIDKRLTFLRKELGKPPFSTFKSFKLLDSRDLVIPQDSTKLVKLPNGKVLRLTFKERLLGRKDRLRLRMHLSITPPNEKRFLLNTLFSIGNKGTLPVVVDNVVGKPQEGKLVVATTCQFK